MFWPSAELVAATSQIPLVIALVLLSGLAIIAGTLLGLMAVRSNNKLADAIDGLKASTDASKGDANKKADDLEDQLDDLQDDVTHVKNSTTEMMKAQATLSTAATTLQAQNDRLAAEHEQAAARRQAEVMREVKAGRDLAEAAATALQLLQDKVDAGAEAAAGLEEKLLTAMRELLTTMGEQIKASAAGEVDRIGKEALLLLRDGQQIILNAVQQNRRTEHAKLYETNKNEPVSAGGAGDAGSSDPAAQREPIIGAVTDRAASSADPVRGDAKS